MRKVTVSLLAFGVVLMAVRPGHAVAMKGKLAVSPYGGAVIPIGDMADSDKSNVNAKGATAGFNVGGALEFYLTESIALGGRANYNQFGFDEALFGGEFEEGTTFDLKETVVDFGAYIKLLMSPGKDTRPYVRAGAMLAKLKLSGDVSAMGESVHAEVDVESAFGLEGAAGVQHMFSDQIGGFIEGAFNHVMSDGKNQDLTFGDMTDSEDIHGNAQWITARAGLTILFGK